MKTSEDFARAIKERHHIESDYGLAKILHVTRSAISSHRTGRRVVFSDEVGYRIAELLDLPAEHVLSCLAAERAKDANVKKVWERVANLTRVAVLAAVTFAGSANVTPPQAARGGGLYIMSNRRRYSGGRRVTVTRRDRGMSHLTCISSG